MIGNLDIEATSGEFVTFTANMMGKKMTDQSTPSVAYKSENLFRARDVKVYLADTEVGLDTADAICLNSVSLSINKNLYAHQCIGQVDIDSIYNQQFNVSGDFEALYTNTTYQDIVRNGTKKYMRIEIINTDVTLTGGGNPTITITLGKVAMETREQSSDNNEIVTQTVGFVGSYNNDDGYTIKASMINERESY
jgi:hypothetical protein